MKRSQLPSIVFLILLTGSTCGLGADPNAPVDVSSLKPPIRVACLGDSITYGVGAGPGWAYPDQLDRMLGGDWDVRNFGHSGASIAKGDKHTIWNQKEYKQALEFHPDVVVIMLGTNDTKPENWAKKNEFPKLYKELVVSFQKLSSKPRVFCCTAPYVAKKGAFGINEAGVVEQMPMIKEVATNWGAGLIDVHGATLNHDEVFKDNVHPSQAGATMIASAVYQSLTGKAWAGEVPDPKSIKKDKPLVRIVENPGELVYREAYGLIVTSGITADKLAPIKEKFDGTDPELAAKITDLEGKILEHEKLRMQYKRTDSKLYNEHKGAANQLKKDLEKLKRDHLFELLALVPSENRAAFGAAWVNKYVTDRLAPIAGTITPEQRKAVRELCAAEGETYGNITNTPERSIEDVETYKRVYEKVLTPEQQRRVEPR